jgi:glycerol-3-phosphate dehydrogenase
LDDALSRRTRALLLNARATIEMAPKVAQFMAVELGRDDTWIKTQIESFTTLAKQYILGPAPPQSVPAPAKSVPASGQAVPSAQARS